MAASMLKCTARDQTLELVSVTLVHEKKQKKGINFCSDLEQQNTCEDVFQTFPVNSHVTLFFLMRVCITQTKITCTESVPVKLFSVWTSRFVFVIVFCV